MRERRKNKEKLSDGIKKFDVSFFRDLYRCFEHSLLKRPGVRQERGRGGKK